MTLSPFLLDDAWLANALQDTRQRIFNHLPPDALWLAKALEHSLGSSGKLLRPTMTLLSGRLAGCHDQPALLETAAVSEMIHVATLLHDDVLDDADLRRGQPTAKQFWGNEVSILTGDYLLAQASRKLAHIGHIRLVEIFSDVLSALCDGEVEQLRIRYQMELSWEAYLRKNLAKTASLFAAGCESAGVLAQLPEADITRLRRFGEAFGIGFQLLDDWLDFVGKADMVGKPVLTDLRHGLITAPVLLAHTRSTASQQAHGLALVQQLFSHVQPLASRETANSLSTTSVAITSLLTDIQIWVSETGALEATLEEARQFLKEAVIQLDPFDYSQRQPLVQLCNDAMSKVEQLLTH